MMRCGICRDMFDNGAIVEVRDLYGKRRRVPACSYCATWLRRRQAEAFIAPRAS